jgi:hypothetical protein
MKRYRLPESLRSGWIGPVARVSRRRRPASNARLGLIQELVEAGCYVADANRIARRMLAACARRH